MLGYQLGVFRALSCLFTTFPILLAERDVCLHWALQIHGCYYCCVLISVFFFLFLWFTFVSIYEEQDLLKNSVTHSHMKSLNVHWKSICVVFPPVNEKVIFFALIS